MDLHVIPGSSFETSFDVERGSMPRENVRLSLSDELYGIVTYLICLDNKEAGGETVDQEGHRSSQRDSLGVRLQQVRFSERDRGFGEE